MDYDTLLRKLESFKTKETSMLSLIIITELFISLYAYFKPCYDFIVAIQ